MIARAISLLEAGHSCGDTVLEALFPYTGGAWTIGVTGAPGAGKSTLVDALLVALRKRGCKVAALAVDPSSPFTRGALLGDRVRMSSAAADEGVYIRSLATRGALGGIADVVPAATRVLDAAGFEWVIVETVGVGQSEVEVAAAVDCTVLVAVPGTGDLVQAMKAGIVEVADVFAVNKSDLDTGSRTRQELRTALAVRGVRVPVLSVSATRGTGIDELLAELDGFREQAQRSGEAVSRRRRQLVSEARRAITRHAQALVLERLDAAELAAAVDALAARTITPAALARNLLRLSMAADGGSVR